MEAITDASKILMSDILKGNVEEIEEQNIDDLKNRFITCVLITKDPKHVESLVGSISSFLFDEHYELEIRVIMEDAFVTMKHWRDLKFKTLTLHYGTDFIDIEQTLTISAIRIQEIDPGRQTCVLAMKLLKE